MKLTYLLPDFYIEHDFFYKMFKHFDNEVFKDKHVIVTFNKKELPAYGKNVIVILTAADETVRLPTYNKQVGMVFKHHMDHDFVENVFHIPLPYVGGFVGDASIPILERKFDVTFMGRKSKRNDMIEAIRTLKNRKDIKTHFLITGHKFLQGYPIDKYSRIMMNSKITLSPRGAKRCECLRFTEAVKCGCAIVTGKHPKTRLFDNCPATYIKSWADAPEIILDLIQNEEKLLKIHKGMKQSWNLYFSPEAVGKYISKIVRSRL